jgi:hypothetical protein
VKRKSRKLLKTETKEEENVLSLFVLFLLTYLLLLLWINRSDCLHFRGDLFLHFSVKNFEKLSTSKVITPNNNK